MLLGQPLPAAAALGAALALSSTAIVMPLLAEAKRQHSQAGRATFAVLLFQDLAVAPILITLTVVGGQADGFSPRLLLAFVPAALGLVLIVVAGRLLLRPMLSSVVRAKSEELFMAACLLVVIGAGLLSALTGLSMALGAFIAGLLLAETEYRHEVEVTIDPFKGLLLGLFFLSVGIGLDLSLLARLPRVDPWSGPRPDGAERDRGLCPRTAVRPHDPQGTRNRPPAGGGRRVRLRHPVQRN